jgi:GNAT superfamily N-acetyltransferase
MKRLFVPPRNQGKGIGRLLCQNITVKAREDGFTLMRLDTGNLLAAFSHQSLEAEL